MSIFSHAWDCMASPTATDDAAAPVKVEMAARLAFRSSFPVLWRWTSTFCGLMGAAAYAITWVVGNPISGFPTIAIAIVTGLVFAIAAALFPVYVLPEGIRCYNFYGTYRTIGFDEMASIQVSSVFGLKYLVVNRAESQDQIWIPLYLYDRAGFRAAI